jgi:hypothetical protein
MSRFVAVAVAVVVVVAVTASTDLVRLSRPARSDAAPFFLRSTRTGRAYVGRTANTSALMALPRGGSGPHSDEPSTRALSEYDGRRFHSNAAEREARV